MRRVAITAIALVLAFVLPATARAGLQMHGQVKPRHWAWAQAAQANVPLPTITISVWNSDPMYDYRTHDLYVEFGGQFGYTRHDERGSFLHELGHAYDFSAMTKDRRIAFREIAQTSCKWWAKHCASQSISGEPLNLSPGEMFAEEYAACALGLTQSEYEDQGYLAYGWSPPPDSDKALCQAIRVTTPPK